MSFRFRWIVPVMVLAACSGGPNVPDTGIPVVDAAGDAADDASDAAESDASDATVDAAPDSSSCECDEVTTCCDGCTSQNLMMLCDDGLACRINTRCQADGSCAAGLDYPCAAPAEPECQASVCNEPGGCALVPIRNGLTCNDDNPATYNTLCTNGQCLGTPCECSSGPCCDGCLFRPDTFKCIEDDIIGPATCTEPAAGACSGGVRINSPIGDRWCSGTSSLCDGVRVQNGAMSVNGLCTSRDPDGMPQDDDNPLLCRLDASDPLGARCRRWCAP